VLHAVAMTPPYDWDLTNIRGKQTISVTATDSRGQTATTQITVDAPIDATSDGMPAAGCTVAGNPTPSPPAALALFALALIIGRPRRRKR
jgi:MYXO-CTERM domain-containing protein